MSRLASQASPPVGVDGDIREQDSAALAALDHALDGIEQLPRRAFGIAELARRLEILPAIMKASSTSCETFSMASQRRGEPGVPQSGGFSSEELSQPVTSEARFILSARRISASRSGPGGIDLALSLSSRSCMSRRSRSGGIFCPIESTLCWSSLAGTRSADNFRDKLLREPAWRLVHPGFIRLLTHLLKIHVRKPASPRRRRAPGRPSLSRNGMVTPPCQSIRASQ